MQGSMQEEEQGNRQKVWKKSSKELGKKGCEKSSKLFGKRV